MERDQTTDVRDLNEKLKSANLPQLSIGWNTSLPGNFLRIVLVLFVPDSFGTSARNTKQRSMTCPCSTQDERCHRHPKMVTNR